MNLFELFVKIDVDDQASGKLSKLSSSLGKGLATAAKVGTVAIGAASTAIVALGKIGLDYNKQIETYTTNFEVMMGDAEAAAKKVEELKEMGARTPFELGDLANATQTLLAFNVSADDSTGVLQKLGDISLGNVQKLESLTRAYGKMNASQKVTLEDINMMIDAGFNPLLIVAEETGKTMTEVYDDISKGKVSFEQIEDAISKATSAGGQFYQGMQKASQTTEGLISTLKDNATALVGEVYMPISEGLTNTVLPSAINAINTLSEAFKENGINGMIAAAGEMLGSLVNSIVEYAPKVVDTAVTLVNSLIQGLSDNQESIATGAIQIITSLANGILSMLPQIVALGLDLIVSLANGIADSLPELIPTVVDVILQIVDTLTAPDQLSELLDAALVLVENIAIGLIDAIPELIDSAIQLINNLVDFILDPNNIESILETALNIVKSLAEGLVEAIPQLIDAAIELILKLVEFILDPENIEMLLDMSFDIVSAIAEGLIKAIPELLLGVVELIDSLIGKFGETDWWEIGKNIVSGLWDGIKELWADLKEWFNNSVDDLVGDVKDILGIASPSKRFAEIGNFMALGLGKGWDDEFGKTKKDIDKSLVFDDATMGISASVKSVPGTFGDRSNYGGVSVVQNIYSEAKTAADLMQEALYQQERAVLLGV